MWSKKLVLPPYRRIAREQQQQHTYDVYSTCCSGKGCMGIEKKEQKAQQPMKSAYESRKEICEKSKYLKL